MKAFIEKNLKKMELVLAIAAFLLFLVGNAIDVHGMFFGLIPFLVLVIVTILSNYKEVNMRVLIWILMGMELIVFFLDAFNICTFHPSAIRFILNKVISYDMSVLLIVITQIFILYLIPILKQGGLLIYSVGMSVVCFVAMIMHEGVSIILLANVIYYMTFSILSYELKSSNQLEIYSKILGYIIDISDDGDDREQPVEVEGLEEQVKSTSKNLRKKLEVAVEQKKGKIVFQGEKFLIDDYEDSQLTFEVEYGETITLAAAYFYDFMANDSNTMLKRKSMLDQTFCDINLRAKVNIELDIDNMEEGIFAIHLLKCKFENTDTQGLVDKMYEFMKVIILLNNSKIY